MDRRYPTGKLRRSRLLSLLNQGASSAAPRLIGQRASSWSTRDGAARSGAPKPGERALVIDSEGFPMEGEEGVSHVICRAAELGWKRIIIIGTHGQRFFGCGLGPRSAGVEIEAYGSTGDYLASGLDGASITVHGNGQDQLGQIINSGKLVVHGDVGQTFMYGAKGGEVYILGNAAGRPLINAVGKPRVVINGTCLDYLAESFMAGDPLNGGGFVVLNALGFDAERQGVRSARALSGRQPLLPRLRRRHLRARPEGTRWARTSSTGAGSCDWPRRTGRCSCRTSGRTRGSSAYPWTTSF